MGKGMAVSSTRLGPLLLRPRFVKKPWGGRRIQTLLGRELPDDGPIGESWEVYDRDDGSSPIVGGSQAGATLADVRGDKRYPLMFKILDARETLSVQVHPDGETATALGGEEKTECWFVLHAEPGARIYRGFADGVTRADVERALADGTLAELLHSFEPQAGDTVFVPAGTAHTIGKGLVLAEVQHNSDTTYRMHDWGRVGLDGRPRELHIEQALRSIRFGPRGLDTIPPQVIEDDGQFERVLLIRCPHFAAERVTGMGTFTLETDPLPGDQFHILHVLAGEGQLQPFRRGASPIELAPGSTVLLPEEDERFEVIAGANVIRALLLRPGPQVQLD